MVVATRQSDSMFSSGRLLDEDKINKALNNASELGAEYAEIRLVSQTTNTASLKDGKLERAIPGQEIGVTMRILPTVLGGFTQQVIFHQFQSKLGQR